MIKDEMVSVHFQREDRYIVIKRSDLALMSPVDSDVVHSYLECAQSIMATWNCPARKYLVIEGDWTGFEPAWAAIEARVTGKPAEQHHSEQSLDMVSEQRQGEPVALPERMSRENWNQEESCRAWFGGKADGWNACLDEIAKLGPLYTYADHGEVDRLRSELQKEVFRRQSDESAYSAVARQNDTLRAQLAERDALLRDRFEGVCKLAERACGRPKDSPEYRSLLEAITPTMLLDLTALSASAEPSTPASFIVCHVDESCGQSAPVERDERAAYDAWRHSESGYVRPFDRREWSAWQARAALERKS